MSSSAKKLIIVKHLSAIESLARIDAIIFDKTGTLTENKFSLKKISFFNSNLNDYTEKEVLKIIGQLSQKSCHHVSLALRSFFYKKKEEAITQVYKENFNYT